MTGCTYGKGNLFHLDYGKNAFTFIRRSDGRAIRIVVSANAWGDSDPAYDALRAKVTSGQATDAERAEFQERFQKRSEDVLERPLEELFLVQEVQAAMPARARIHNSITCAGCGERVMETRARLFRGESFCIPCFEARDRRYS